MKNSKIYSIEKVRALKIALVLVLWATDGVVGVSKIFELFRSVIGLPFNQFGVNYLKASLDMDKSPSFGDCERAYKEAGRLQEAERSKRKKLQRLERLEQEAFEIRKELGI